MPWSYEYIAPCHLGTKPASSYSSVYREKLEEAYYAQLPSSGQAIKRGWHRLKEYLTRWPNRDRTPQRQRHQARLALNPTHCIALTPQSAGAAGSGVHERARRTIVPTGDIDIWCLN